MVMRKISKVAVVLVVILTLALGCSEQTDGVGAEDTKKDSGKADPKDSKKTEPKSADDNEAAEMEFISLKVTGMT